MGKLFSDLFFKQSGNALVKLKTGSCTAIQYKAEGPHVLFYMTTTKANLVSGEELEYQSEGVKA